MIRGHILLYRKIIDNPVYKDSKSFHVLCHLLLNAKTRDTEESFNGNNYHLSTGQLIVTTQTVANEIGLEKIQVYRILKSLNEQNIIKLEPQKTCCVITIINYEEYQGVQQSIPDDHILTSEELSAVMSSWGKVSPDSFKIHGKWAIGLVGKERDRLEGKTFKQVKAYLLQHRIYLTDELFCERELIPEELLDEKRRFIYGTKIN